DRDPRRRLMLEVRDSGTGIAKEISDRIFEPFFTTEERTKGTGMGLAVVDGVVRAHQGKIEIESEEGKGTTIRLLIPLRSHSSDNLEDMGSQEVELDETGPDPEVTRKV
ncbi:MAG: hypothetical protein KDB07_12430, partial [Planctomycetes bacterium]|nr:hypothetical protein [Planctomycetota bacterium]